MKKIEFIERYGEEAYRKHLEQQKQYYQQHREEKKQYYQQHREEIRECQKQYDKQHIEEKKEYKKQYYQQHREEKREHYKQYQRKHNQMFAYCIPEQIEQIENYESAKKDNFKGWCIHHRFECAETGGKVIRTATAKELQELGLYYNRPASELIFLTISEHIKLHNKNRK